MHSRRAVSRQKLVSQEYTRIASALQMLPAEGAGRRAAAAQLVRAIRTLPPDDLQRLWTAVQVAARAPEVEADARTVVDADRAAKRAA